MDRRWNERYSLPCDLQPERSEQDDHAHVCVLQPALCDLQQQRTLEKRRSWTFGCHPRDVSPSRLYASGATTLVIEQRIRSAHGHTQILRLQLSLHHGTW